MDYNRKELVDWVRGIYQNLDDADKQEALRFFPELSESEEERIRTFLLDYAIEMIAGLESDISLSTYDGIKGHDPDAEAELAQWQKARAYLEKQKDPHYTKRNALFDKCVENCDPEVMKEVSNKMDEMLGKKQEPISSCDIVPYIDEKIAALQDMWREEKVAFDWDDLKDMIEDVARHFAQWGAEHAEKCSKL